MRAALALSLALMGLVPSGVMLTAPPALAVQPDEVLPDAALLGLARRLRLLPPKTKRPNGMSRRPPA